VGSGKNRGILTGRSPTMGGTKSTLNGEVARRRKETFKARAVAEEKKGDECTEVSQGGG